MAFILISVLTAALMAMTSSALPVDPMDPNEPMQDILQASHIGLQDMANVAMSPTLRALSAINKTALPIPVLQLRQSPQLKVLNLSEIPMESIDNVQQLIIAPAAGAVPLEAMKETGAVGSAIPAVAAVKGSVVGSAIATPIILKAVALPGIAAGKTAAMMSLPHLIVGGFRTASQNLATKVQTAVEDQVHQISDLLVEKHLLAPEAEVGDVEPEDNPLLVFDLSDGLQNAMQKVILLKAGALANVGKGVAGGVAGGIGAMKMGALALHHGTMAAGRLILKPIVKPIAILTGIHLKMLGSGLAMTGKMVKGTGAGIALAGTAVKYAGLGGIGMGASAVSWGLDRTTIDTHMEANVKAN